MIKSNLIFDYPERMTEPHWWIPHIPFAFYIVEAIKPRIIVELGVHTGNSYNAFCQAVSRLRLETRCYGIDHWKGDAQSGSYGEQIFQNLKDYQAGKYSHFSTLYRIIFDEAMSKFEDGSIDLLHIDGFHSYEAVKHDFETWKSKLSDRSVVLFHDTQVITEGFGVKQYWSELIQEYPHFEFKHSGGLGVLKTGSKIKLDLFDQKNHTENYYLGLFSRLGTDLINSHKIVDLERQLKEIGSKVEFMSQKYSRQEKMLNIFRNSLSFRLGLWLTAPFRLMGSIFKK